MKYKIWLIILTIFLLLLCVGTTNIKTASVLPVNNEMNDGTDYQKYEIECNNFKSLDLTNKFKIIDDSNMSYVISKIMIDNRFPGAVSTFYVDTKTSRDTYVNLTDQYLNSLNKKGYTDITSLVEANGFYIKKIIIYTSEYNIKLLINNNKDIFKLVE